MAADRTRLAKASFMSLSPIVDEAGRVAVGIGEQEASALARTSSATHYLQNVRARVLGRRPASGHFRAARGVTPVACAISVCVRPYARKALSRLLAPTARSSVE
jgi:hypothetical protein